MKKYSFLVYHKEYSKFLVRLRDLGVVHIRQNNDPKQVSDVYALLEKKQEIVKVLNRMKKIKSAYKLEEGDSHEAIPHTDLPDGVFDYPETFIDALEDTDEEIAEVNRSIEKRKREIEELMVWGDFDPELLKQLKGAGYLINFWSVGSDQYDPAWEDTYHSYIIQEDRRLTYFVTVTAPDTQVTISADHLDVPLKSIDSVSVAVETLKQRRELLEDTLAYLSFNTHAIEEYELAISDKYNISNALIQGEHLFDDKLIILEGWIPADKATPLESYLEEEEYAYTELEIGQHERVPIKLKNNFFVRVFEPLVKLYSLPNYHELDPTPLVAPFFMLFFAMCFGDAGYGLLLLLICTYYKFKVSEDKKPILTLFQYLGGAAVVVGFFAGSFFGIELAKVQMLSNIREYFISSQNMMVISIAVGVVQILTGKFVAAYKTKVQHGLKFSLAEFAWAFFILVGILMAILPKFSWHIPMALNYVLYAIAGISLLIIVFYNSPGKNIFLNIGNSLWTAYNTISGLLGDSLSYIRLFAIGLTGGILGSVFNTLAFQMTDGVSPIFRWLLVLLILLFGHSINFALAMIGSLVHPIRLIFVEYFNNSQYEGGGVAYDPLRKLGTDKES